MTPTPHETLLLLAVFAFAAIVFWLLDPAPVVALYRRARAWVREEARLARAESWANGVYEGPPEVADSRIAKMAERQRELAERMRAEGRHLFNDRAYKPALTKPVEAPPPKAAQVYPIRRAANGGKR